MNQNLYTLYEEDVHPELLPTDRYAAIKQKYSDLHMQYWSSVIQPQAWQAEEKIDAYLDAYAKKVGLENYDAVSNTRMKTNRTPEEIVALREFDKVFHDPKYKQLHDEKQKIYDKEDAHNALNSQNEFYEILQQTCKLAEPKDVNGNPLPDNAEWLRQYHQEVDQLKNTGIMRDYNDEMLQYHIGMKHAFFGQEDCNEGVMFLVEPLHKAGYEVVQFRSGMVQDWPYARYTQDDPAGRYKAGDHKFWGTQEPMTRLLLLDKDYNVSMLEKIAAKAGMRLDRTEDGFEFRFPATRDGSSMKELVEHFAMKMGISTYAAQELRQAEPQKFAPIVDEHGGYTIYTDEMIRWRLDYLTARLVNQVALVNRPEKAVDVGPLLKDVDMGQMFREFISLAAKQMGPEKTMELLNEAKENAIKQQFHVYMDTTDGGLMVLTEKDAGQLGILEEGRYIDLAGRIDKVNVYQNHEGTYMVRCRIDGQQQMGRPLGEKQLAIFDQYKNKSWNDLPKLVIAGQVYADTVIQMNGMNREQAHGRSL